MKEKRLVLTSLKQICNEYLIKFSENQSAPKLENRKTSPYFPGAPNLLHVLTSRMVGWNEICNPVHISFYHRQPSLRFHFIIATIIGPVQYMLLQINLENFRNLNVARIESQKPGGSTFGLVEQYLQ